MPRFRDEWVIDRVMFDYISGGSCACCGFQHFLPNGTADLVDAISDLDTDAAQMEKAALANHPWPADVRDQVWADRVRLRQKLKRDRGRFADFWSAHGQAFEAWCRTDAVTSNLRRWLQLPRTEVMEVIQAKYDIHSAFGVVLCKFVCVFVVRRVWQVMPFSAVFGSHAILCRVWKRYITHKTCSDFVVPTTCEQVPSWNKWLDSN